MKMLVFLLALTAAAIPMKRRSAITDVGRDLAKAGLMERAEEILGIAEFLRTPPEKIRMYRRAWVDYAARSRGDRKDKARQKAAKRLTAEVPRLERLLDDLSKEDRYRVARALVWLDADSEPARQALGHVRTSDGWQAGGGVDRTRRRVALRGAVGTARKMPILTNLREDEQTWVKHGWIELTGTCSLNRLDRIFQQAIRTVMLANYMLTDKLEIPVLPATRFMLLESRGRFLGALDWALGRGIIDKETRLRAENLTATFGRDGNYDVFFMYKHTEAAAAAGIASDLLRGTRWGRKPDRWFSEAQANLLGGITNLACLLVLGEPMPGYAVKTEGDDPEPQTRAGETREKRWLELRFPKAGLQGHRRHLIRLVKEGKAPSFADTMVAQVGGLTGDRILVATSLVEFLLERGPLLPTVLATWPDPDRPDVELFEKALGKPLATVWEEWTQWLLATTERGLIARLRAPDGDPLSPGALKALSELNRIREEAGIDPVNMDPVLSQGAAAHARYLLANPKQLTRWPDAHEEWPGKEGFSPEGAWAGSHSVIAPGVKSPAEAFRDWMGTFYHRLPLLQPGLLLGGWGHEGEIAVLDVRSLMIRPESNATVLWPPDGATGVPLRFVPELPNPVPGSDQSRFGYPITLQCWRGRNDFVLDANLALAEGKANGPIVPCHLLTPKRPMFPELAPSNAFCLIPKAPLKPNTRYHVTVMFPATPEFFPWSFTTGSK